MKKNKNDESFFTRVATDEKYKAKVELMGYGVFILVIIVFANISALKNNHFKNTINEIQNDDNEQIYEEVEKDININIESINDNYEYKINLNYNDEEIIYTGKRYKDDTLIINGDNKYYKLDNKYYKDNEIIDASSIYKIDSDYLEYEYIKKYLKNAQLDHKTEYSSGKKEYLYNLEVKNIIRTIASNDIIEIKVGIEEEKINITIDYSNLYKNLNKNDKVIVNIEYTNINKIEEFVGEE